MSPAAAALLFHARRGGVRLTGAELVAALELAAAGLAVDESVGRPGGRPWVLVPVGIGATVPLFSVLCACRGRGLDSNERWCPHCACPTCGAPRPATGSLCIHCNVAGGKDR